LRPAAERNWLRLAKRVKATGAEPLALELDLMAPTAAEFVVKETLDRFGRIDALVNIAGAVAGLDVFQMTDEQWNTGMELKFHGARRLTIRAWDALRGSKGAVVFISGNAAVILKAARRQSARSMPQSKRWPRRSLNAALRTVSRSTAFRPARS
jgi:NAD(P)-dependent dehydrogenase (short-subunit alcohol dehydrogenase family)